jgi:hypothetical protein
MVHLYYHLNERGIAHAAAICSHAAREMETRGMTAPVLCLRNWTPAYPLWSGVDLSVLYTAHKTGKICSQHQKGQEVPYLELGGINGGNSFSIRKLTDWMDKGEKEAVIDDMNKIISDFIKDNDYHAETGATDDGHSFSYSLQEMIENSMAAGAKEIHINGKKVE